MDLSYQLNSSRNFPTLSQTLRMLAEIGYRHVEGHSALLADAASVDSLRSELPAAGLTMPTAHFDLAAIENEPARVFDIANVLGIRRIYCPALPPDARPETGAGYEAVGRRLQEAGRSLREAGLGLGWHNHGYEFETLRDGAVPLAALFEGGPDLEWEADLAWVIKGGADPFRWIDTCADRITAVHIKDIAPLGQSLDEGGWTDVGIGTVPWPALMAALRTTRVEHYVLEHDAPSDDRRFAENSFVAVQGLHHDAG